jgi:hypothetical protein
MRKTKILFALSLFLMLSCSRTWTEKDRQTFLGGCLQGAKKDMDSAKAKGYCSCMLEKLQKRYPDPSDMKYVKSDTAVYSIANDCLKNQ